MENHADRKEVKYARENSVYVTSRTSQTLGEGFMYSSTIVQGGNILRLAHGFPGFLYDMNMQLPAILSAVIVALILSSFLAARFSREVTSPLEKLVDALLAQDYEKLVSYKSSYYEVDRTLSSIKVLLQKIEDSKEKLNEEREKVKCVLSNMVEGFILMDNNMNILLCNNSAKEFFSHNSEAELTNIYNLTKNKEIISAIQSVLDNK
jgi:two-component system phosphate regulon sensor histidine kinase PhoR